MRTVRRKLATLVFDYSMYPRHQIDRTHVAHLAEAIEAGAKLPPIVIDKKTKRISDGFHRATALRKTAGEDATVEVVEIAYGNDAEMFLDAARRNAGHGHRLSNFDRVRCIELASQLDIEPEALSAALVMPVEKVAELRIKCMAEAPVRPHGPTPIKRTIQHMAGRRLTPRQSQANEALSGMRQVFYANQLIHLIEGELLQEDDRLWERLVVLHGLLGDVLSQREAG